MFIFSATLSENKWLYRPITEIEDVINTPLFEDKVTCVPMWEINTLNFICKNRHILDIFVCGMSEANKMMNPKKYIDEYKIDD